MHPAFQPKAGFDVRIGSTGVRRWAASRVVRVIPQDRKLSNQRRDKDVSMDIFEEKFMHLLGCAIAAFFLQIYRLRQGLLLSSHHLSTAFTSFTPFDRLLILTLSYSP